MRLNRVLSVNNRPRQLIEERIILDLKSPGRAVFTVVIDEHEIKPNQLVTFDLGYSRQTSLQRWFIGFVETIVPVGEKRLRLRCRELAAALVHNLPLQLRHVSATDVLAAITERTGGGLDFVVPEKSYADTRVANFYNIGSGYLALENIGRVFKVDDLIWQQQAGKVFVGSWADSRWAKIPNLQIPAALFDQQTASESARIAALPKLRPGLRVNGNRITSIEFRKNHMVLSWKA